MIDESFNDHYLSSFDNKLSLRLFRLLDVDGQMRFSFEVMIRDSGFVFYKLPESFWLYNDDRINWSTNCNILFFTVLHLQKAFIYDVTFMTLISCDLRPNDTLRWDEEEKMWRIFEPRVSFTNWGYSNSFCDNFYLKLPYPSNAPQANFKVIPTPNPRYTLVLSKVQKSKFFEPNLWTMGIVDTENALWVVDELPYHILDDAVRFRDNNYLDCYGLNPQHSCCYLFRFDCDNIPEEGNLIVFVNDFSTTHPEKVVWDVKDKFWRAVIKGKVILPRPFYFDNNYTVALPIVSNPIPLPVLQQLPKSDSVLSKLNELLRQQKQQLEKEYKQNNTPASEIFSRMGKKTKWKLFGKIKF